MLTVLHLTYLMYSQAENKSIAGTK